MVNRNEDAFAKFVHAYPNGPYGLNPPCIDKILGEGAGKHWQGELAVALARLLNFKHIPLAEAQKRMRDVCGRSQLRLDLDKVIDGAEEVLPDCASLRELCERQRCVLLGQFYRCTVCGALWSSREPDLRCLRCGGKIFIKLRQQPGQRLRPGVFAPSRGQGLEASRVKGEGAVFYVRYLDHVLFRDVDPGAYAKPFTREAVGWLDREDGECIQLVWERFAEPAPSVEARQRATGLVILKSAIVELRRLGADG